VSAGDFIWTSGPSDIKVWNPADWGCKMVIPEPGYAMGTCGNEVWVAAKQLSIFDATTMKKVQVVGKTSDYMTADVIANKQVWCWLHNKTIEVFDIQSRVSLDLTDRQC
jgi:hypothetical protein